MFWFKRVGALHFFRNGRFGGSVYLAKRKPTSSDPGERFFIGITSSLVLCAVIHTVIASI